jgi:hypothetical protein
MEIQPTELHERYRFSAAVIHGRKEKSLCSETK